MPNVKRNLEQSLKGLQQYVESIGYWPTQKQWNKYAKENNFYSTVGFFERTKKSWETLRQEMGYPPRNKQYTKEDCIKAIKQASNHLGELFTKREYVDWQKDYPELPSANKISRICGGWNSAKVEAGLFINIAFGKEFTEREIFDALKSCAKIYGVLFSEEQYLAWRSGNPEIPHIETIRRKLGGIPEAKRKMGLESYAPGPQIKYSNDQWKEPFMRFIVEMLNYNNYIKWAKESDDRPSMSAIVDNAGGYEQALLEVLSVYMKKIKAGRKRGK